jgi:hypothetical protein
MELLHPRACRLDLAPPGRESQFNCRSVVQPTRTFATRIHVCKFAARWIKSQLVGKLGEKIVCSASRRLGAGSGLLQVSLQVSLQVLLLCIALAGCHQGASHKDDPKISFTQVPESNPGNDQQDVIEGAVVEHSPDSE